MSLNMLTVVSRNLGKGKCNILSFIGSKRCTWKLGYISSANITSKANRDPNYVRKPPFPYKEKNYTMVRSWFDSTSDRFDENSKIIVVDGPIACGKSAFAKQLSEDLDMLFMPEANMDMIDINSYGYDLRTLNDKLPTELKRIDEKSFCLDPFQYNTAAFQFEMFELRLSMYIDALAHVMNTGQGVIMVRSAYSDMVFVEAMEKMGYIKKNALKNYYILRNEIFPELMRPHLQIYLDIPVSTVQERIKAKGRDWEIKSPALTPAYLEAMEDAYKRKYLPEIEDHAELLIYDWSEPGDLELIIEDIERLNFDKYTVYDKKMRDWRFPKEQALNDARIWYTNSKHEILSAFSIPMLDCPELYVSGENEELYWSLIECAPGQKYLRGYNADMGDKGVLFKTRVLKDRFPYFN